ncbi:L,D-transpeptidase/peptidoglycan binding protein [Heyndrickxia sporothermodurans]|uniref:L,D-transpeptidase family protein n=1 Tax=Heyndrickxia sporothermodurans TaxID=46224 RepID=UPI002DB9E649|nr:L,D-transpeptidase family protein [Heyndrickxia sporothermodurans]MEB6549993.1 L,D-transpeptidase/peptidoglycan binding protein [Heyndrickxia sporothermodurans]
MNALNEMEVINKKRSERYKKPAKRILIVIGIIFIMVLLFTGLGYYQATHFNSSIKINSIKVGGLTANQVINKLKTTELKNRVYIGNQQILDGKPTKMAFTEKDLSEVKKLLKSQWTFFPSFKEKNYSLVPKKADQFRSVAMKKQVEEKLLEMNKSLKAPQDADAKLEQGEIVISDSKDGKQYDVDGILEEYKKQIYTSDIHLKPLLLKPIKKDSPIIKEKEQILEELLKQTVDYKVQKKVHPLKASELIKNASVSNDKKITITASDIKKKIDAINRTQATLDKNFTFKTHSGKNISVKAEGYGWAINAEKEAERIQKAFEKGDKAISASNIYGKGWSNEGIGYETTANHGIGNTYAEVSIAKQHIWIYKNGKLVVSTDVVTGKHSTGEDTSPGIWYILYKRTPYTLKGTAVGKGEYAVDVKYWAPFTNSGQGFHDASWRKNWSKKAYLNDGSGGCVNTPPSIMKAVYDNLSTYDPVVIY